MNVDLVIALDAAPNAPLPQLRLPALETLLARGDRFDVGIAALEPHLMTLFGYDPAVTPPSAALCVLGEGLDPGSDYWLHADPVCLAATRTHLTLTELPEGDLTATESETLADALKRHLSEIGCALATPHSQRWYLRLAATPNIRTLAPSLCSGTLDETHLPSGSDAGAWKRLITEAQMLLHGHPVNSAREAAGKLPANAIWPWGGGRMPHAHARANYARIFGVDPLTLGLARAAGIRAFDLPCDANALSEARPLGTSLAVMRTGTESAALDALEQQWFKALAAALGDGRLSALSITLFCAGRSIARRITRSDLHRWWRRKQAWIAYA